MLRTDARTLQQFTMQNSRTEGLKEQELRQVLPYTEGSFYPKFRYCSDCTITLGF